MGSFHFGLFCLNFIARITLDSFFKLLALTIQHEKPDLEDQKTKLLQQEEDKKIQLAKLEESLLEVKLSYSGYFSYYIILIIIKYCFFKNYSTFSMFLVVSKTHQYVS